MASLFPLFLKLDGRKCVVVGAGRIAAQKVEGLLDSGAALHIIAPEAGEEIQKLARSGRVSWTQTLFKAEYLEGALLVIAATGNPAVNEEVYRVARDRGVLCNSVDEPERCDFYYPAVVRRGDLQIAISTAGKSPALAQRIRKELEEQFDSSYIGWLNWLGSVRELFFRRRVEPELRKQALHHISGSGVFNRFKASRRKRVFKDGSMGKVYLVGAGPGDPELLTLRAAHLLQKADIVLHDALVSAEILALIHTSKVIDIGKRCGTKLLTQQEINALLVAYASQYEVVVRLKGGDPSIFGRVGEEIEALVEADIPCEVIPGVTSAIASAAAAGISLTDRRFAASVVFATARRGHGAAAVAWDKLVTSHSTLAIYMPGGNHKLLAEQLCDAGLDPLTCCVVISHTGRPTQQVRWRDLTSLKSLEALPAPSLLIVGECARPLHVSELSIQRDLVVHGIQTTQHRV
jgi:uroporphyrin-III C-methyltransferase/precorrin-2 dehydrogenase/sirohydrochlorin ferrochelatase